MRWLFLVQIGKRHNLDHFPWFSFSNSLQWEKLYSVIWFLQWQCDKIRWMEFEQFSCGWKYESNKTSKWNLKITNHWFESILFNGPFSFCPSLSLSSFMFLLFSLRYLKFCSLFRSLYPFQSISPVHISFVVICSIFIERNKIYVIFFYEISMLNDSFSWFCSVFLSSLLSFLSFSLLASSMLWMVLVLLLCMNEPASECVLYTFEYVFVLYTVKSGALIVVCGMCGV